MAKKPVQASKKMAAPVAAAPVVPVAPVAPVAPATPVVVAPVVPVAPVAPAAPQAAPVADTTEMRKHTHFEEALIAARRLHVADTTETRKYTYRPRLADYDYAVFVGNTLISPASSAEAVQQIIAGLSVKQQGRVVVMRRVPVTVETKVTFKG